MGKIITQCPSCDSSRVQAVKIECVDCHTRFEGQFEIPSLVKLPEDDLRFILDFVKCSGSLKEMAANQNVSYPTLRNRLNSLIDTINHIEDKQEGSKSKILQMLEDGKITAKDAANMLRKI
ncbi:MAG: DUF2089 family protein [Gammaproteobacteria bacterium]|jgi:hypothetical protein